MISNDSYTNSPATGHHIRSPWLLRSGGQGYKRNMTYGSAVGAIHTYISSLTDPSGIEFRIRLIPRLGASVKLDILIPLGNALHSHETMDMPPRYGAGFSVSSQNGETPFFSKMGWQNDNHLALSSGGVLTNG